jgi:hypothetical protein
VLYGERGEVHVLDRVSRSISFSWSTTATCDSRLSGLTPTNS